VSFRSTQNRWFVRCHTADGECRWECESDKDKNPSSQHTAAYLRYMADMIDYLDKRRADIPVAPTYDETRDSRP
jgi:hypothetical protein